MRSRNAGAVACVAEVEMEGHNIEEACPEVNPRGRQEEHEERESERGSGQ